MAPASILTFKTAVANISDLPLSAINVDSASNVYARRRLRGLLSHSGTIIGVDVNYTISVVEDFGTNDPNAATTALQNKLTIASSGDGFESALKVAAATTGDTFLTNVYSNVTIAIPQVEKGPVTAVSNSASPTPAP